MKYHLICSCIKCKTELTTANLNIHYDNCLTNTCKNCNTVINNNKKFCNRSCAAIYNNKYRTPESRQQQAKTVSQTLTGKTRKPRKSTNKRICSERTDKCVLCTNTFTTTNAKRNVCDNHIVNNRSYIKTRFCPSCNIQEFTFGRFQHEFCPSCRTITEYRGLCNFTHDLRNYPNEYDLILLEEHGMFHPKKNPKGVSRDHMYSVHDGYHNKVDPSILKHPANCSIMLQTNNTIKHSTSSITYEELLERIRIWDEKYN
ncbi:hypothetical protein pEaSNUABM44_00515 [Erwinia phage pEa_SNUABM_44]|nr:hypothetical protein pEaSNUABM44_00515 [Erwinia phage pEa_SNUABM_44]